MKFETIARPYAKAVFDVAKETNALDSCLESIQNLSSIILNKDFRSFIHSPNTAKDRVAEVIMSILPKEIPTFFRPLIELLVENDRLPIVPSIYTQLHRAVSLERDVRRAEVIVACKMSDAQLKLLSATLTKRYDCKIEVTVLVDKNILGGAVIKMDNDAVFDGSLSTRLDTLGYLLAT